MQDKALERDISDLPWCICTEFSFHSHSLQHCTVWLPQVNHYVCCLWCWTDADTLLCKHEEVLKSQNLQSDLSLKLKMNQPNLAVLQYAIFNYWGNAVSSWRTHRISSLLWKHWRRLGAASLLARSSIKASHGDIQKCRVVASLWLQWLDSLETTCRTECSQKEMK